MASDKTALFSRMRGNDGKSPNNTRRTYGMALSLKTPRAPAAFAREAFSAPHRLAQALAFLLALLILSLAPASALAGETPETAESHYELSDKLVK